MPKDYLEGNNIQFLFDEFSRTTIRSSDHEAVMSEIFLQEGFPLTTKVEVQEDFYQNKLYRVTAPDFCKHSLFVCLDEQVHPNTVDLLTMEKEDIFVCLDSALNDVLKTRLQDRFNVHVI